MLTWWTIIVVSSILTLPPNRCLSFLPRIFNQILKDAEFLKRHNIIEYSLLIGIHYVQPQEDIRNLKENSIFGNQNHRSVLSQDKQEIYFFGIIDILSEFTAAKKLESGFFSILNFDISCKDP